MNRKRTFSIRKTTIFTVLACAMGITSVQAAEIKVGMSTALSGPAQALGQGMKMGVEAYFNQVNQSGINGNTLKLVALDDGYEPARAAPNMRKLIDEENVLAVMGNVGTPTAIVSVPIANEKKTLLFGAFTGAGVLRQTPPDRYIINYRASYAEETAAMIDGLLSSGIKPEEVAFFTQNDGYGDAGYKGAMKALKAKGVANPEKLAHGRYTRNTLNVEDGLGTILDAEVEPKAVIMVGAYGPCAKFIKMAKEDLPDTKFLNVSFVGSTALAKALGDKGDGVIVTQVVPHFEVDLATVKEYQEALKSYDATAEPGFVSLEGYLVAKLFVEGLKKAGASPNRESLIDALESLSSPNVDIGTKVGFSKTEHQASHKLWPTMLKQGKFVAFNWSEI
ncbi:MAG: ligand-binding receptor [Gammaproteobacteria bacterium (ex Lamellibrachia satsuma)]|nr:MAG: ABC transporter substrate-binding protein [Gammaproteobacteria bacterium (ex Lamellibrachia satsuma)]RRS33071.1 MAG: ligand-binding receptor [Gammaproteobacteria bacterium (ex Lamellibrachia satsuma)]RRS35495.1 MAG: ligand-binding receptor [Gammaproteobacteria bacterium (ex Lamellibrachia satsuma)]